MSGESLLVLVGCLAILALIITLALKRIARDIPIFFAFINFELLLTLAVQAFSTYGSQQNYLLFWCVAAYADVIFYFAVISELGRNLLRAGRNSTVQPALAVGLFLLLCFALFRLIQWGLSPRPFIWRLTTHTVQITGLLQLAAFLALVIWSNLKKLRWPRREFRIGSGIGFFALVEFADAIVYSYPYVHSPAFHWLSYVPSFTAIGVYFYWLEYFLFEDTGSVPSSDRVGVLVAAGRTDDDSHSARNNSEGTVSADNWLARSAHREGEV
ncbi:MAG TPA: hypothetical protein VF730_03110 [Terracidiphilus sp.]